MGSVNRPAIIPSGKKNKKTDILELWWVTNVNVAEFLPRSHELWKLLDLPYLALYYQYNYITVGSFT